MEDPLPLPLSFVSLHCTDRSITIPKSRARLAREGRNWSTQAGEGNSESDVLASRKRITHSRLPSHTLKLANGVTPSLSPAK